MQWPQDDDVYALHAVGGMVMRGALAASQRDARDEKPLDWDLDSPDDLKVAAANIDPEKALKALEALQEEGWTVGPYSLNIVKRCALAALAGSAMGAMLARALRGHMVVGHARVGLLVATALWKYGLVAHARAQIVHLEQLVGTAKKNAVARDLNDGIRLLALLTGATTKVSTEHKAISERTSMADVAAAAYKQCAGDMKDLANAAEDMGDFMDEAERFSVLYALGQVARLACAVRVADLPAPFAAVLAVELGIAGVAGATAAGDVGAAADGAAAARATSSRARPAGAAIIVGDSPRGISLHGTPAMRRPGPLLLPHFPVSVRLDVSTGCLELLEIGDRMPVPPGSVEALRTAAGGRGGI